jgi:hypothetical protein
LHDDNSIDFFLEIENWKLTTTTARYPIKPLKTYLLFARSDIFYRNEEEEKKKGDDDDDDNNNNHAATK